MRLRPLTGVQTPFRHGCSPCRPGSVDWLAAAAYSAGRQCVRAAAGMSWTLPGSAGQDHTGDPAGSVSTCTLPPCFLCLPQYNRW